MTVRPREFVVLDFETTGLSPDYHRTIEVAAVRLVDNQPADELVQLMNPGHAVPAFITELTGITNDMLRNQPKPEQVMPRLRAFVGACPIVAHNASFDSRFFLAEMKRAGLEMANPFVCTMRLARRLEPGLASYRLQELVRTLRLHQSGPSQHHRALADVQHTIALWKTLHAKLVRHVGPTPSLDLLGKLMRTPVKQVPKLLASLAPQPSSSAPFS